jgi:hypothetical protein
MPDTRSLTIGERAVLAQALHVHRQGIVNRMADVNDIDTVTQTRILLAQYDEVSAVVALIHPHCRLLVVE